MPRLTPVSWLELIRRLRVLGFAGPFEGSKHPYMMRGDHVLTIPNPHRSDISVDLLKRILERADVSRDAWLAAGDS